MDYDYWLTKSYLDAQEVTQEQFKEFCVEKAVEALPDGTKDDWAEWIDEHEDELREEFDI